MAGGPGGMSVRGVGSSSSVGEQRDHVDNMESSSDASSAKSMKVETVLPTGGTAVTAATTTGTGAGPAALSGAPLMPGEGKQYWAKGTGYGTGARASQPHH